MTDQSPPAPDGNDDRNRLREELERVLKSGGGPKAMRFALAVLSGAIPWVGGIASGVAGAWGEQNQAEFNEILQAWLKLQEDEIKEIGITMAEILMRLDLNDETIAERIRSPAYLSLIRKCFRDWAAAESEEKRRIVRDLLSNAAATRLCPDDVIRLFIEWISSYSEAHFRVIRDIYQHPRSTRLEIWRRIHGERVREDSAEADLFRLIIRDLSTGAVVRQSRQTDGQGRFVKGKTERKGSSSSPYMKSAFDNEKPYELTQLGEWFVHYTMNEIVPRIADAQSSESSAPEA